MAACFPEGTLEPAPWTLVGKFSGWGNHGPGPPAPVPDALPCRTPGSVGLFIQPLQGVQ